jgi:hypothetical protein
LGFPVEPLEVGPEPRLTVTVLERPGFVCALNVIAAVPLPNPAGTFTVAVVLSPDDDPVTFAVFDPFVNVIEYVKPSPAFIPM